MGAIGRGISVEELEAEHRKDFVVAHWIDGKLVYKKDDVADSEGFLGESMYWPLISRRRGGSRLAPNIGGVFGPEWFEMVIQPGVGLQVETGDSVFGTGASGEILRGKFVGRVAAYPFATMFRDNAPVAELYDPGYERGRLEIAAEYIYWQDFASSGGYDLIDDSLGQFSASANYFFGPWISQNKSRPFALGLEYLNGDNPEEGFFDDKYWRLSLKIFY